MKVLITGGCGFLGSNLAESFLEKENDVFIIDSLRRVGSKENLNWLESSSKKDNLKFFQADITNTKLINDLFQENGEFDFICHVAGQVAMTTSIIDPRKDFEVNALGTFNILEATRKFSPGALLAFSSTNKVYGDLAYLEILENESRYTLKDFPCGLDENTLLDFSTPYGCSKGSADQYVRDWGRVFGLKTVIFRHSSIYGGRQFATIDQGWVGWFCSKVLEQKYLSKINKTLVPFTISGNGKQVRDVLHSDDLINLYHCAFDNKETLNGEIFNIGGGFENSLSILELIKVLEDLLSFHKIKYKTINRRASDQDCFIANINKAKDLLNWEPKVSYREGLKKMIDWSKTLINEQDYQEG